MVKPVGIALLAGTLIAVLAGCDPADESAAPPPPVSRAERVAAYFDGLDDDIVNREKLSSAPSIRHLLVDEDQQAGGAVLSLWASEPGGIGHSRCFYLDEQRPDGSSHGFGGCGDGGPPSTVSVGGNARRGVGDVGRLPATTVRIAAGRIEATVAVVHGYFLVPSVMMSAETALTITVLDGDEVLGIVVDLTPPDTAPMSPSPAPTSSSG